MAFCQSTFGFTMGFNVYKKLFLNYFCNVSIAIWPIITNVIEVCIVNLVSFQILARKIAWFCIFLWNDILFDGNFFCFACLLCMICLIACSFLFHLVWSLSWEWEWRCCLLKKDDLFSMLGGELFYKIHLYKIIFVLIHMYFILDSLNCCGLRHYKLVIE